MASSSSAGQRRSASPTQAELGEPLDAELEERVQHLVRQPIQRLDEAVVNRIAAGEIIHRPANALKELIENSLDAGATLIKITLKEGGLKSLQIQDNGCGVRESDLPLLAERFATSKLRNFDDLSRMSTFGFRGEALASISYVSASMRVVSKTKEAACAFQASYACGALVPPKPGQSSAPRPCAGTDGTLITAEDLFFNVPQRLRALKSATEEYNRALDVAAKYALHYGGRGVGFVCRKASSNVADLSTPASPSTTTIDAIRALHGSAVSRELLHLTPMRNERLGFSVEGYISGANWSAKKTTFLCFINDRLVDCPGLKKSFEALCASFLPRGGHPWIYISLKIAPEKVDVNVHPTKSEVHFLDEEDIIEEVCAHAQDVLSGSNSSRTFDFSQATLPGAPPPDTAKGKARETQTGPMSAQKGYPQHQVRTDASSRTLQAMGFTATRREDSSDAVEEAAGDEQPRTAAEGSKSNGAAKVPESECLLTSVRELRREAAKSRHNGLTEVLRGHTFVGVVDLDMGLSLVQHETKLYLVNHAAIIEEFAYQLVLRQFGSLGRFRLEPAPSIRDLIRIGVEAEPDADAADMSVDDIVERIAVLLIARAEMLDEYFSLRIDAETGTLQTIPSVLSSRARITLERLPTLLLRLGPQVDWTDEKECFRTVARELAFAHVPPSAGNEARGELDSSEEEVRAEEHFSIQHAWFSAMRRVPWAAPKQLLERDVVQVASLPDLYRVFERC